MARIVDVCFLSRLALCRFWFDRCWIIHLHHWAAYQRRLKEVYPSIKSFDAAGLLIMTCHTKYPNQSDFFQKLNIMKNKSKPVWWTAGARFRSLNDKLVMTEFSLVCIKAASLDGLVLQPHPALSTLKAFFWTGGWCCDHQQKQMIITICSH